MPAIDPKNNHIARVLRSEDVLFLSLEVLHTIWPSFSTTARQKRRRTFWSPLLSSRPRFMFEQALTVTSQSPSRPFWTPLRYGRRVVESFKHRFLCNRAYPSRHTTHPASNSPPRRRELQVHPRISSNQLQNSIRPPQLRVNLWDMAQNAPWASKLSRPPAEVDDEAPPPPATSWFISRHPQAVTIRRPTTIVAFLKNLLHLRGCGVGHLLG